MTRPTDWVIGIVEKNVKHPGAGRYAAFMKPLGIHFINSPVRFRFMSKSWLATVEFKLFRFLSRHPLEAKDYPNAFGIMVQELWALLMMKRSPGSVFHSIKGETDMHNLPRWSRRTDARLAITFHDALDQFGSWSLTPEFLRHVDGIVALCESQRSYFTSRMAPERVRVVHHGVNTEFFRPGPPKPFGATVISVGSYCRDHKVFLAAIPEVWATRPDVHFVIVGLATMPQTLPERIDDPRISYVDGISDEALLALYHQADLAAIALWAATANNALLEAMSCGLPVVATDIGGISEYLGPDAGLTAAAHDPSAFADAILRMLADPVAAKRMGKAGRQRAVEMFDYNVTARKTQEFYDQLRAWPQAPADTARALHCR